jgi:hypothetical protein
MKKKVELPAYGTPGRILVRIHDIIASGTYRYEAEVLDYDADSGVFWINEGVGFDYWLDTHVEEITEPGIYVIEGVKGAYIRGTWGLDDDDEEWEFERIRPATAEEIETETLA